MLEFLREGQLAPRFRTLTRDARRVLIAAPFWGHGAIQSLGINQLQNVLAICNLRYERLQSACNRRIDVPEGC